MILKVSCVHNEGDMIGSCNIRFPTLPSAKHIREDELGVLQIA